MTATTTKMDLRWLASSSTSCFHVAGAIARGRWPADANMADLAAEPVKHIRDELSASGVSPARFWRHVTPLSAGIENNRELAQRVLQKAVGPRAGSDELAARLAGRFQDLENAFRSAYPQMAEELALRGRPLREQWEARGPGLLTRAKQWTDENILAPRADVVLVQPALGGGGQAHPDYNIVHIEGVLANPHDELPETIRLAWLLLQLQMNVPVFGELVHFDRLPFIAAMAMAPVALHAAAEVELTADPQKLLPRALEVWEVVTPPGIDAPALVQDWWETYTVTRPPWRVALAALDRMMG